MFKKILWPLILVASISLAIVFIGGFIVSVNINRASDMSDVDKEDEIGARDQVDQAENRDIPDAILDTIRENSETRPDILIMGDSIGFGVGDEEGLGIGKRYINLIDKDAKDQIGPTNISVPGYESGQLVDLIKSGENEDAISKANLIIISIGGNDLNRMEYEDDLTMEIVFKEGLETYKENMGLIIKEIREINPDAQLAFIGLYNPYSREEPEKNRLLLEWNYETSLIVDRDTKFAYIPTYDQFKYHLDDYLSTDEFHPSALGYQFIAEELDRILN